MTFNEEMIDALSRIDRTGIVAARKVYAVMPHPGREASSEEQYNWLTMALEMGRALKSVGVA